VSARRPRPDYRALVDTAAASCVDEYLASRPAGPHYLCYRPADPGEALGGLAFLTDPRAPWVLADPRAERGFTPRTPLIALVAGIARRLPIVGDEP
jgi:hypothetical protein